MIDNDLLFNDKLILSNLSIVLWVILIVDISLFNKSNNINT